MLGVKKLGLLFLVLKLGEFPLFDNFFFSLADFWDLDNFLVFNNFLDFSINLLSPSIPPTLLTASTLLMTSTCDDSVILALT